MATKKTDPKENQESKPEEMGESNLPNLETNQDAPNTDKIDSQGASASAAAVLGRVEIKWGRVIAWVAAGAAVFAVAAFLKNRRKSKNQTVQDEESSVIQSERPTYREA